MESQAYHKGYNAYWREDGEPCMYELGTVERANWWAGWEAAVAEDKAQEVQEERRHTPSVKAIMNGWTW